VGCSFPQNDSLRVGRSSSGNDSSQRQESGVDRPAMLVKDKKHRRIRPTRAASVPTSSVQVASTVPRLEHWASPPRAVLVHSHTLDSLAAERACRDERVGSLYEERSIRCSPCLSGSTFRAIEDRRGRKNGPIVTEASFPLQRHACDLRRASPSTPYLERKRTAEVTGMSKFEG
jgi:hypothetical protein